MPLYKFKSATGEEKFCLQIASNTSFDDALNLIKVELGLPGSVQLATDDDFIIRNEDTLEALKDSVLIAHSIDEEATDWRAFVSKAHRSFPTIYPLPEFPNDMIKRIRAANDEDKTASLMLDTAFVNSFLRIIIQDVTKNYLSHSKTYLSGIEIGAIAKAIIAAYPNLADRHPYGGSSFWHISIRRRIKKWRERTFTDPNNLPAPVAAMREKFSYKRSASKQTADIPQPARKIQRVQSSVQSTDTSSSQSSSSSIDFKKSQPHRVRKIPRVQSSPNSSDALSQTSVSSSMSESDASHTNIERNNVGTIAEISCSQCSSEMIGNMRSFTINDDSNSVPVDIDEVASESMEDKASDLASMVRDSWPPMKSSHIRKKMAKMIDDECRLKVSFQRANDFMDKSFSDRIKTAQSMSIMEQLSEYPLLKNADLVTNDALRVVQLYSTTKNSDYISIKDYDKAAMASKLRNTLLWLNKNRDLFKKSKRAKKIFASDVETDDIQAGFMLLCIKVNIVNLTCLFDQKKLVSIAAQSDGKWFGIRASNFIIPTTNSLETILTFMMSFICFNLKHPKSIESLLEALEIILSIRKKNRGTNAAVKKLVSILPF